MTRKVFWENPYLTELETTVTSVENNDITVEYTIFYAQSGGQESDHGTINNYRVIQARKEGKEIIYTLENGHGLRLNDRVKMVIDWESRYQLMQLHFAAEVMLELTYQKCEGVCGHRACHFPVMKHKIRLQYNGTVRLIPSIF